MQTQMKITTQADDAGNIIAPDDIIYVTPDSLAELETIDMSEIVNDINDSYQIKIQINEFILVDVLFIPGLGYEINTLFCEGSNNVRIFNKQTVC
jgi:hypothetical protein